MKIYMGDAYTYDIAEFSINTVDLLGYQPKLDALFTKKSAYGTFNGRERVFSSRKVVQ